jgi:hypothetical protein
MPDQNPPFDPNNPGIVVELQPLPVSPDQPVIAGDINTQVTLTFRTANGVSPGTVSVFSTTDLTSQNPPLSPVSSSEVSATNAAPTGGNTFEFTATVHQEITEDSRLIFQVDCGNNRTAQGEVRVDPDGP